jgi:hypothetical protein
MMTVVVKRDYQCFAGRHASARYGSGMRAALVAAVLAFAIVVEARADATEPPPIIWRVVLSPLDGSENRLTYAMNPNGGLVPTAGSAWLCVYTRVNRYIDKGQRKESAELSCSVGEARASLLAACVADGAQDIEVMKLLHDREETHYLVSLQCWPTHAQPPAPPKPVEHSL